MKRIYLVGVMALAQLAAAQAAEPYQRPIKGPATNGWVRVALDAEAQAALAGAWVGDEKGASVPFQQVAINDNLSANIAVNNLVMGRGESGLLTAEFHLQGARLRDADANGRNVATLAIDVDATAPWVAEVRLERRKKGGAWLALNQRLQIYDFGGQGTRTEISVPWDAGEWRLRLVPIQGKLKQLTGVSATGAKTVVPAPRRVIGTLSKENGDIRIELGAKPVQVVGFEVELSGVVAPVNPSVSVEIASALDPRKKDYDYVGTSGLLWRMPGLKSNSTQFELVAPTTGKVFRLTLPENTQVEKVEALVREDELMFVAEEGRHYFLHQGGLLKAAPGNLYGLPETEKENEAPVLTLGSAEPDPYGIPFRPAWSERLKPYLPWVVGVMVLLMTLMAWRVVRQKPEHMV